VWCQIARTFDKNQNLLKICFKKKPFAVYIRVPKALGTKFGGALVDGTAVFLIEKKRFHRRQSGKPQFKWRLKRRIPTERGGNACGEN
jgi:hypothetical protein